MYTQGYALVDGYSGLFYIFKNYPNWEHAKGTKVYLVEASNNGADIPLSELLGCYASKWWRKVSLVKEY